MFLVKLAEIKPPILCKWPMQIRIAFTCSYLLAATITTDVRLVLHTRGSDSWKMRLWKFEWVQEDEGWQRQKWEQTLMNFYTFKSGKLQVASHWVVEFLKLLLLDDINLFISLFLYALGVYVWWTDIVESLDIATQTQPDHADSFFFRVTSPWLHASQQTQSIFAHSFIVCRFPHTNTHRPCDGIPAPFVRLNAHHNENDIRQQYGQPCAAPRSRWLNYVSQKVKSVCQERPACLLFRRVHHCENNGVLAAFAPPPIRSDFRFLRSIAIQSAVAVFVHVWLIIKSVTFNSQRANYRIRASCSHVVWLAKL